MGRFYCHQHRPLDFVEQQTPHIEKFQTHDNRYFKNYEYKPRPMFDERYQDGKIYKLYHVDEPHVFYIGSTIFSLDYRLKQHKKMKSGKKKNDHFNDLGWNGAVIELIEDAPCNNRDELEVIERQWIHKLKPELNTSWNA